jgi:integrase
LVFPSRDGKPLLLSNMYKLWWKPLCKAVNLIDDGGTPIYGFHSARHFRASEKIAIGANGLQIKKEIGHANISTTMDIYGHLFPEDLQKQREQAEEIERKLAPQSAVAD